MNKRNKYIKLFNKIWYVKEYSIFDMLYNYHMTTKEFIEEIGTIIGVFAISFAICFLPYVIESIVK